MTDPAMLSRPTSLLRVDASGRRHGSVSRDLGDRLVARFMARYPGLTERRRDLAAAPLPQVDEPWIIAKSTPAEQLTAAQRTVLDLSDRLIAELTAADIIVIGAPIYNFSVPAGLKAWIDLITRPQQTFRYTDTGPVGLLTGKRTLVIAASGGTRAGSPIDFATGYLDHVLGFIGLHPVELIDATGLSRDRDTILAAARARIDALAV